MQISLLDKGGGLRSDGGFVKQTTKKSSQSENIEIVLDD